MRNILGKICRSLRCQATPPAKKAGRRNTDRNEKSWRSEHDFPRTAKVIHQPRMMPGCTLKVGDETIVEGFLSFEREGAVITIGARCFVNGHIISSESVVIGDDVLISWNVTVVDHDSHSLRFSERCDDVRAWAAGRKDWSHVAHSPVEIGSKAWIGFNVSILKGIKIGEGAVVGAGSVVTKDVPAWTVVAGNPARVVRKLSEDER